MLYSRREHALTPALGNPSGMFGKSHIETGAYMTLHHITVESGHTRISPRSEVSDKVVEMLTPLLRLAIDRQKAGNSTPVALSPSDWYIIKATEQKDRQNVTIGLGWGMPTGDAMIEVDVDIDPNDQDTARCRVWLTRPKALTPNTIPK